MLKEYPPLLEELPLWLQEIPPLQREVERMRGFNLGNGGIVFCISSTCYVVMFVEYENKDICLFEDGLMSAIVLLVAFLLLLKKG